MLHAEHVSLETSIPSTVIIKTQEDEFPERRPFSFSTPTGIIKALTTLYVLPIKKRQGLCQDATLHEAWVGLPGGSGNG